MPAAHPGSGSSSKWQGQLYLHILHFKFKSHMQMLDRSTAQAMSGNVGEISPSHLQPTLDYAKKIQIV